MKRLLIAWSVVGLGWMAGCGNAHNGENASTSNAETATGSDTAANAGMQRDDSTLNVSDSLSRMSKSMGWEEVQPYDLPVISTYTEVVLPEITVHGNERMASYGLNEDVLFDEGQSVLKPSAERQLRQISESIAQRFPKGEIRIFGYTDSLASKSFNRELSEQRAEAVKSWLVQNGKVEASRISIHPMGESKPVASNATEKGRRANRRVEIVVRNQS